MSDLTKEELLGMLEMQSKLATAIENIAGSYRHVVEEIKDVKMSQKTIEASCSKCQLNLSKELEEVVDKNMLLKTSDIEANKKRLEAIDGKVNFIVWVFGGVGIVVAIVVAIVRIITFFK